MTRRPLLGSAAAVAALLLMAAPAAAEPATGTTTEPTTTSETPPPTSESPATSEETTVETTGSSEATSTTDVPSATEETRTTESTSTTTPKARAGVSPLAARGLSVSTGGSAAIVPGTTSASGSLPLVTVTSGGGGTWTATASSNGFSCPSMKIPADAVTYSATAPAGGLNMDASSNQNLGSPKVVMTSRSGLAELVTWTPILSVGYPNGASICTFSGTITVSVA